MAEFTDRMLEIYRKWRDTAERSGWGTSQTHHDALIDPADPDSGTIRETILANCPWYYGLERILHGGDLEVSAPVSIRKRYPCCLLPQ